ncbi:MAG: hypothetical protein ABEK75_03720 [Salinibacter sp.]
MNPSSPYGPDRSLLLAIGVLTGMLLICAGGVYVASSLPVGVERGGGGSIVGTSGPAPAPPRYAAEGARSRGGSFPIASGGVPAWAGLDRPSVPTEPFAPVPQGRYAVNPDFGHAELGVPPGSGTSGGAAIADVGSPGSGDGLAGGALGAGPASSTPNPSGTSSGRAAARGDAPEWRSEAQTLASRSRALSREVVRLNREEAASEEAQGERTEQPADEASTASSRGGAETNTPGTPSDPEQVPLGGVEWLAAAGAAYALNRLREEGREEFEDDA